MVRRHRVGSIKPRWPVHYRIIVGCLPYPFIAAGAKADLVIFDGGSPGKLGWLDPVEAVINHSNVGDVEHVIVGGTFVKRDGK